MREILFRGKDVRTGYWKEGSLVREWLGVDIGYTIRDVPDRFNQIAFRSIVDPKTVGQFTGLTDKNGKKIFEGDILVAHYKKAPENKYVVKFCPSSFEANRTWENTACHLDELTRPWIEVVGNIHDNPELLEVDK